MFIVDIVGAYLIQEAQCLFNMERGILGIKKDPRNAVLFSFKTRQGDEWPSSDSQDSDYNPYIPQNEDVTVIKTTKKRFKVYHLTNRK